MSQSSQDQPNRAELLRMINRDRSKFGLGPVQLDAQASAWGNGGYPSAPGAAVTFATITREDVERHYRARYRAAGAAVTIVGDLSIDAAKSLAEQLTARLAQGGEAALPAAAPPATGETARVAHPSAQSHVVLGEAALTRDDPDYFPLLVGNYILGGGGFASRLMTEVRSKHGLAYSVYSYFYPYAQRGPFQVGSSKTL